MAPRTRGYIRFNNVPLITRHARQIGTWACERWAPRERERERGPVCGHAPTLVSPATTDRGRHRPRRSAEESRRSRERRSPRVSPRPSNLRCSFAIDRSQWPRSFNRQDRPRYPFAIYVTRAGIRYLPSPPASQPRAGKRRRQPARISHAFFSRRPLHLEESPWRAAVVVHPLFLPEEDALSRRVSISSSIMNATCLAGGSPLSSVLSAFFLPAAPSSPAGVSFGRTSVAHAGEAPPLPAARNRILTVN